MERPFVAVATPDAIPSGKFIRVQIDGQSYLIVQVEGRFHAVEDRCSHEDYPLSYGCLEGDRIKCSLHGSRFSLVTGAPLDEPAEEPIRTCRVVVAQGWIWVDPTHPAD